MTSIKYKQLLQDCIINHVNMVFIIIIMSWNLMILSTPLSAQPVNDSLFNQQTYLQTVNIPQAWNIETGSTDITIGVLAPGGVFTGHEDLSSRVTVKHQGSDPVPFSVGTLVSGISVAATNNSKGIAGINWNSPVFSYEAGKSEEFSYTINGVQFTEDFPVLDKPNLAARIDQARTDGVDILLAPFHFVATQHLPTISSPRFMITPDVEPPSLIDYLLATFRNLTSIFRADQELTQFTNAMIALREAYKSDVTIVSPMPEYDGVLRGMPSNLNPDRIAIAVGATNLEGDLPFQFSASGSEDSNIHSPEVDVVAPGVNVLTTVNTGIDQYDEVSTVAASSGIVGGIASLLKSNNPDLKPDDIREILRLTAVKLGAEVYDQKTGFGLVNADAALQYVQNNTISHGVVTNTTSAKIQSDEQKTLFKGAWANLASGVYFVDVYRIEGSIDLTSGDDDVWYRADGTTGWSLANPNFQRRFALVEVDEANAKANFTTFVYHIKSNSAGQQINQWHPAHKDDVEIAFTVGGNPLPEPPPPSPLYVNIDGPTEIQPFEFVNYLAVANGGNPPYNYAWKIQIGSSDWQPTGSNSDSYSPSLVTEDFCLTVDVTDTLLDSAQGFLCVAINDDPGLDLTEISDIPNDFILGGNYPNPFNPVTTIEFALPEASDVTLEVFNIMGQKVSTLVNERRTAGFHSVQWDASRFSSGTYFLRMAATGASGESFENTGRMTLIK